MSDWWKDLETPAADLARFAQAAPPLEPVQQAAEALLRPVRERLQEVAEEATRAAPAEAERIALRRSEPTLALPERAPLAVLGAVKPQEVLAHWSRQLQETAAAVSGFVRDDRGICGQWFQDWTEGSGPRYAFYRAEHVRAYLLEVLKLCRLLTVSREVRRLSFGAPAAESAGWETFGREISVASSRLAMRGSGIAAWWKTEVLDGGFARFRFLPRPTPGNHGGALFAFPAAPLTAEGYEASCGPMERYNYGLETYHVSLSRGKSGVTNLRRTGRGLRMLSTVAPDPCAERGRAYRVEVAVKDSAVIILVDGLLQHHYFDAGAHGPPLRRGRLGVRLFSGAPMNLELAEVTVNAAE